MLSMQLLWHVCVCAKELFRKAKANGFQNKEKWRAECSVKSGRQRREGMGKIPSHFPNSWFITKAVRRLGGSPEKWAHEFHMSVPGGWVGAADSGIHRLAGSPCDDSHMSCVIPSFPSTNSECDFVFLMVLEMSRKEQRPCLKLISWRKL